MDKTNILGLIKDDKKEREPIKITLTYPNSNKYEFESRIEIIDLDKECQRDLDSGNGFLISSPKATNKKDIKNIDGIYSSRFGQKIGDTNPFADRYSCECGALRQRINHGLECPICHTKCKYVDDDFKMFGWIVLKDKYHLIHPKFYDSLDTIFGASPYNEDRKKIKSRRLKNMLNYSPEVDQDGFVSPCSFKPDKEPFYGIGMMEFYERFDEILDYYIKLYPKKMPYYTEIKKYRDRVFCHSVPVFTTHLRPADIRNEYMYFEPTNGIYNIINKHIHQINKDKRRYDQNIKIKNSELFKAQMKFMDLTDEIMNILTGKKGQLRMLVGGRYNFSSRCVIRQNAALRPDQVLLPYVELVKTLQQRIINILMRTYNISPSDAYDIWSKSLATKDERVAEIITTIIRSEPEGLPVIINRNPTINYGSILQVFCVGFTDTLTMSVSLQVLKLMAADFDGDVLNVMHIINQAFFERAYVIFNPRNAMYISRIDGKLNSDMIVQRDTLINANTLMHLGRKNYTKQQMKKIAEIKKKQKEYFGL